MKKKTTKTKQPKVIELVDINVPAKREIAYVIKDKYVNDFEVVKSANAWWNERTKVESLIQCFKQGYNIKQACIYIGINEKQWQYFNEIHPNFCMVKEACEEVVSMMAETGIAKHIQNQDKEMIKWYAERRIAHKYGKSTIDPGMQGNGNNNVTVNNIFAPVEALTPVIKKRIEEMRRLRETANGQ